MTCLAAITLGSWILMTKAAAADDFIADCEKKGIVLDKKNIYANYELSTEDVISEYHERINKEFNKYIRQMMQAETAAVKTGKQDLSGLPPAIDETTRKPKACAKKNYSTYCVGERLLTDPEFGYMSYRKALDCRKGRLFDTQADAMGYSDYAESVLSFGLATPSKIKADKVAGPVYQAQKALEISSRLEAITREKAAAKEALDQTLSAYNELRVAWPMHKKYQEIYVSLLKYRDKLIEVRNYVENFPSKFIDATTTKCT